MKKKSNNNQEIKKKMEGDKTRPLYRKIPLKNKSPEAIDLIKYRITIYSVPSHLILKSLRLEEEAKKNLKKEEEKKE